MPGNGDAAENLRVTDVIPVAHPGQHLADIGGVGRAFVLYGDDLHALRTVCLIPRRQEGGFVYAIGAPGTPDRDDNDFSGEARVVQRYYVTVYIREREAEGRISLSEAGKLSHRALSASVADRITG